MLLVPGEAIVAVAGPDTCDQLYVREPGGFGKLSSLAEPVNIAEEVGKVMVWSAPALTLGGWLAAVTVTVVVAVAVPEEFEAVKVYVVVLAGLTVREPVLALIVNVPGVMATVVAAVEFHERLVDCPPRIEAGVAVKD